jgi:hypothetical protein
MKVDDQFTFDGVSSFYFSSSTSPHQPLPDLYV